MSEWQITDASFAGFKFHTAIPKRGDTVGVMSQEETMERRLQVSERALVDGADVEDFGAKARTFSATVIFFGADYRQQLKDFKAVLNSGKTGILVLPDLDESVFAKFQKAGRRTDTDGATILSISWIEDKSTVVNTSSATTNQAAQAAIQSGNVANGIPTVQDQAGKVLSAASDAKDVLTNNAFVSALQSAENSVVSARQQINSVLNVPRTARQNIISVVGRVTSEITGLQGAINGILNFTDLLSLGLTFATPTRINSTLGKIDFAAVDDPKTSIVSGNEQVITTPEPVKPINNYAQAVTELEASRDAIIASQNELDGLTNGQTEDFKDSTVLLLNQINDLLFILREKPTRQVLTVINTSLMEVCFNNGLQPDDMDRVYRLNTNLTDILNIPAFTVVNL